jgi:hypothetical protein
MTESSYKPSNQDTCNNDGIVTFTTEQQQHKTPEQLFLHFSNFMLGDIAIITRQLKSKNANQKDIKLLNSENEAAACLVKLVNKEREKNFSTLAEMQQHMAEQAASQTKKHANESSEDEEEDDEYEDREKDDE